MTERSRQIVEISAIHQVCRLFLYDAAKSRTRSETNVPSAKRTLEKITRLLSGEPFVESCVVSFRDFLDESIFPTLQPGGFSSVEELLESESWGEEKLETVFPEIKVDVRLLGIDEIMGQLLAVDVHNVLRK